MNLEELARLEREARVRDFAGDLIEARAQLAALEAASQSGDYEAMERAAGRCAECAFAILAWARAKRRGR